MEGKLILQTNRLRLKPFDKNDFEYFFETMIKDSKVMEFFHSYHAEMSETELLAKAEGDFLKHFAEGFEKFGYLVWAIYPKDTTVFTSEKFIGWCGIQTPFVIEPDYGPEVAYMIASRFFGFGYATEAANAVVEDAFERFQIPKIHAVLDTPNIGSKRVIEKCSFSMVGQVHAYGSDEMLLFVKNNPLIKL